ncbi:MAG: hypothetical protein A2Z31_08445 [candidate division NC10 bacterium RBG_16_65_8]|nr:MAG: hypothetical protein A2Z31_08445 [candidate division NC10 bacterium RBG_16_65_8]
MLKGEAKHRGWIVLGLGFLLLFAGGAWPSLSYGQEAGEPEKVQATENAKIITMLVTRISSDRVLSIEVFPPTVDVHRGDTVVWLNAVPGTMASVMFEDSLPAEGMCDLPARPAAMSNGRYTSGLIPSGNASSLCLDGPGTCRYRVTISTQETGALLNGILVVR